MERTRYTWIESPVGALLLAGDETALTTLAFSSGKHPIAPAPDWIEDARPFTAVQRQLDEYFASERREFDLPLRLEGTPFQREVWQELCRIPYGETISYGELARRIGRPNAPRAVGLANGSNPIAIVVPCHRVIGSSGALTGFGGGLETKARLLSLERGQLAVL